MSGGEQPAGCSAGTTVARRKVAGNFGPLLPLSYSVIEPLGSFNPLISKMRHCHLPSELTDGHDHDIKSGTGERFVKGGGPAALGGDVTMGPL